MPGIQAYAVHVPRLAVKAEAYQQALGRCAARIEAKRTPDHDEDEATLALAAARALLALGGPPPSALVVASATAGPLAGLVAEALGLDGARAAEPRGPASGVQALLLAQDMVQAHNAPVLVVASDAPRFGPDDDREHGAGAAAMALLVTAKGPVQLRRSAHASALEVGPQGKPEDALARALRALTRSDLAPDAVAHLATHDLHAGLVQAAQRALPKAKLAMAGRNVGDAGSAAPLLALAMAVEQARPGEVALLAGAGAGVASVVAVEIEAAPPARTLAQALQAPSEALDYARHARLRGWLSAPRPDVSQGAAVSPAQYLETLPARLRVEGQRCKDCSRVQFPPREACLACAAGPAKLERLRLSGQGAVHSVVTVGRGSAPAEFAEQQRRAGAYDVAIVELAEGPRVAAQVCDAAPGSVRIGQAVELVVRRLYVQDGAPRYGFKARPVA